MSSLLLVRSECQRFGYKYVFCIWWVSFLQLVALWDKPVFWFKAPYASKYSPGFFSLLSFGHIQDVLLTNRAYIRWEVRKLIPLWTISKCVCHKEKLHSLVSWVWFGFFNSGVISDNEDFLKSNGNGSISSLTVYMAKVRRTWCSLGVSDAYGKCKSGVGFLSHNWCLCYSRQKDDKGLCQKNCMSSV